jgi:hypothetical protein
MGFQFKMKHKIIDKLKKAGAISRENAVTCEQAHLNQQEKYWLGYFAGVFLGKIKKTKSHKYYVN